MTSVPVPAVARRRVEALRRQIRRHDRLYYEQDRPEISDAAYDRLVAELRGLERAHPSLATTTSPTAQVAGAPAPGFARIRHLAPMLSLDSVTDAEAVRAFLARVRTTADWSGCVAEPKLDGLSIEVVYRDGVLAHASTRGNGDVGENVTANVRTIAAVPRRLRRAGGRAPAVLAVRGEVIMHLAEFRRLNAALAHHGAPLFANPRNAAAGSLRQIDARVTKGRALDVFFYDVLHVERGPRLTDGMGVRRALAAWGLRTPPDARRCDGLDEIAAYHARLARRRDALDFEIDGVVLKLNDLSARALLGTTGHHPRWALAYKFPPREEQTVIRDIVVQVGRTGVLTPVARLEPVALGGVTVSRATLHNRDEVARLDLRIGDIVRIVRAGDVIPDVVGRVATRRGRRPPPFRMPRRCPVCGTAIVRDGAADRCPNGLACPAQLKEAIRHFGSRQALDIRGLGVETVESLVASGLVRSVADLFALRAADLARLGRFGDVSSRNLIQAIAHARDTTLPRFLLALGIPEVGAQTARALADAFGSLAAIRRAGEDAMAAVSGVGPVAARAVVSFFRAPANRRVIDACLARGVRAAAVRPSRGGRLSGQTVVFTGTLQSLTRDEAEARVRARGGTPASSVSRSTSLVVAGANPGSKYARAQALGVPIVDERTFLKKFG